MRYGFIVIILAATMCFLTACETGKPVEKKAPTYSRMDMMTISRGLSDGSVDVYDPSDAMLTMPAPPNQPMRTLDGTSQKSSSVMVSDPSVTIYSLDDGQSQSSMMPEQLDMEPLMPLSGPDIQPPQSANAPYPSPFPLPKQKSAKR